MLSNETLDMLTWGVLESAAQNENVQAPTLYSRPSAGETTSRAVAPCMLLIALDELHLFLFALFMPPAVQTHIAVC